MRVSLGGKLKAIVPAKLSLSGAGNMSGPQPQEGRRQDRGDFIQMLSLLNMVTAWRRHLPLLRYQGNRGDHVQRPLVGLAGVRSQGKNMSRPLLGYLCRLQSKMSGSTCSRVAHKRKIDT